MSLLTSAELQRIERKFAVGISSGDCVDIFKQKGERFSEATLRKYVQLGLLPKSKRVGTRGRHKGSSGVYPVTIIRLINEIKRALEAGGTLEEIRVGVVGLGGEVEMLERTATQVFRRFSEALEQQERSQRGGLKKLFDKQRKAVEREIRGLSKLGQKIGAGNSVRT